MILQPCSLTVWFYFITLQSFWNDGYSQGDLYRILLKSVRAQAIVVDIKVALAKWLKFLLMQSVTCLYCKVSPQGLVEGINQSQNWVLTSAVWESWLQRWRNSLPPPHHHSHDFEPHHDLIDAKKAIWFIFISGNQCLSPNNFLNQIYQIKTLFDVQCGIKCGEYNMLIKWATLIYKVEV